jgi:serine/threonine protein kinase
MHSSLFSEYQSIAQFARGSATELVLAQSLHTPDDQVIFKIFNAVNFQQIHEQERFQQEVYTLKQLHHPYILPLLHAEIVQGHPILVSKYMSHGSLRTRLSSASPGRIPLSEALPIIVQIGQALSYAHAWNVLHSAIKPENILFDANGHAQLADFPIPTLLAHTISSSQTHYMAPEQHTGQCSKESDQYALGCLAYEILTGHAPEGDAPVPLTQLVPGIPQHIDVAVLKALAADPTQRHASINAFIEGLTALSLKVSALPPMEMNSEPAAGLEQQLTAAMNTALPGGDLPAEAYMQPVNAAPDSTMNMDAPMPGVATMASAQWDMSGEPVYASPMEPIAVGNGQAWQSSPVGAYPAQWQQEVSMPPPLPKRKMSRMGWVIIALVCVAVLTAGTVPMLLPLANNPSKVEQQKTATPIVRNSPATETPEPATPTATAEATPTEDPAAQDTPVAQEQATTPTPVVVATPTPRPTATPTPKPTATPTPRPTATPTPEPTDTPTPRPTATPTPTPTATPTPTPTPKPKPTCCWLLCRPCK